MADISLQLVWGSMNFVRYMQGEVPAPCVVALLDVSHLAEK